MSTPKEIVTKTLQYEYPERLAHSFGDSDLIHASPTVKTYATDWEKNQDGRWVRQDEWGNLWGRMDDSSKGEVIQGVLDSLDCVHDYIFPDYSHMDDYLPVQGKKAQYPNHWLIGSLPGFTFNIARKMRRMDHYLYELAADPDGIHRLNDRVDEVLIEMITCYGQCGVDSIMFPEDWGTQRQTLISPAMWRKEFLPRFEKLCSLAHSYGMKVFMHSCGQISAIAPDLIRAGIDLLQFDQPDLHGIDHLAAYQEESKITFWCPVDIQTTLQTKNEVVIRSKVIEMLTKLWRHRGGFVAGYYEDNVSIGLEPHW